MSQRLYAAAPDPKKLYLVPEAGHNNVAEMAGEDYLQTVQSFLRAIDMPGFEPSSGDRTHSGSPML
jgi:fermentation-respiration switch protein FrsA (DUF1100 family)